MVKCQATYLSLVVSKIHRMGRYLVDFYKSKPNRMPHGNRKDGYTYPTQMANAYSEDWIASCSAMWQICTWTSRSKMMMRSRTIWLRNAKESTPLLNGMSSLITSYATRNCFFLATPSENSAEISRLTETGQRDSFANTKGRTSLSKDSLLIDSSTKGIYGMRWTLPLVRWSQKCSFHLASQGTHSTIRLLPQLLADTPNQANKLPHLVKKASVLQHQRRW